MTSLRLTCLQVMGYITGFRYAFHLLDEWPTMFAPENQLFCATYHFGGRRPLKLPKFRQVNDNESILVTDLQVTLYVFGSNAFYLVADCLTVCPFGGSFFCTIYHVSVTIAYNSPTHICPTTFTAYLTFRTTYRLSYRAAAV